MAAATELTLAGSNPAQLQRRQEASIDPFEPQDSNSLLALAKMVSQTDFAPKDFRGKPEACAIAMMYGKQLGIPALQALQSCAVINGRPSIYGDAFWAIILSHPEFVDVEEKSENTQAHVKLTRRNRTPKEVTFTQADAQKAGLWGKQGPWTQYPSVMLLWRARTFAARALFPDALKGITSSYEAEDSGPIIDATVTTGEATTTNVPALQQTISIPAKISQDTAREFGKAWKASGYTMAEAKEALKRIANVEASLDLTVDKVEEAMKWATKNPNWPNAVESPDQTLTNELFGILSLDLVRQSDVIARHTTDGKTDWASINAELNKQLPTE